MTYEYQCSACGHEWEAEQPISAKPLKKCPSCKRSTAKRLISGGSGFILKGGGWYADGYASSGGKNGRSSSSSGSTTKSAESTSKSSDSKTGSKADSKSSSTGSKAGASAAPA
jgi:putative FmdB family regulatory protein